MNKRLSANRLKTAKIVSSGTIGVATDRPARRNCGDSQLWPGGQSPSGVTRWMN